MEPTSAEWHRGHRRQHLFAYPHVDERTRKNLDELVEMAERGAIAGVDVGIGARA